MNYLQILILGLVQGAAELLPVSSSAHVIVAEKLMGLDPSSPEMTFLLVMLHTGTMFAVIAYFWNAWREHYFSSVAGFRSVAVNVVIATIITGIVGLALQLLIEKIFLKGAEKSEVEVLFSQLPLIGGALTAAGLLIIYSGMREEKNRRGDDVKFGARAGLALFRACVYRFAASPVPARRSRQVYFLELVSAEWKNSVSPWRWY